MDEVARSRNAGNAGRAEIAQKPQDEQDDDDQLEHVGMKALFADWVLTADAVRATPKKLEKHAALARYLSVLEDIDLQIAARLFAGVPFPRRDERVLSVGWSALSDVLLERSGKTGGEMAEWYPRHGELGDVAADLIGDGSAGGERRTLADVAQTFDAIAAARGVAPKRELLRATLTRATADEARYIVKIVSGETRIGLREGLLEEAIARAFGRDREEVGRANMLTGDIGDTALRAKHGTLAEPTLAHFLPIGMMLATPVLQLEEVEKRFSPPYVVEDKYDGIRAQVHKAGDRVELYSRTFDRITNRYPELVPPLLAIPGTYVIDGEVLAFAEGRAVPITDFQTRLGRKNVADELRTKMPSPLVAFDILERDGRALLDASFDERQRILRSLPIVPPVLFAEPQRGETRGGQLVATLNREFTGARERGNEGLMVKAPRSPYRPGRRGMEWLKVKRPLRTIDVVVTAVEWGHGKRRR